METIGLQSKARPLQGTIEHYWFENELTGLARNLFHRIYIPFEPFDSGLDYVEQPEQTQLVVEWISLGLDDPAALDGVEIAMGRTPHVEASIYLGAAHNWYQIEKLTLTRAGARYRVAGVGIVKFSEEGVANDERFTFQSTAVFRGAVFELVHTVTEYYDGPRAGIANMDGVAHVYQAEWDAEREEFCTYLLMPIDAETLALALEDWKIWQRWEDAFHGGLADRNSHPALPSDRERHEELTRQLADRLTVDPRSSVRKLGEFRVRADAPARPRGALRALEVQWRDPVTELGSVL